MRRLDGGGTGTGYSRPSGVLKEGVLGLFSETLALVMCVCVCVCVCVYVSVCECVRAKM